MLNNCRADPPSSLVGVHVYHLDERPPEERVVEDPVTDRLLIVMRDERLAFADPLPNLRLASCICARNGVQREKLLDIVPASVPERHPSFG